MGSLVFYILAFLTVLSAGAVVCLPKVIHSAIALIICFCLLAIHYLFLGSEFIAALQILIYAGAIMVLLVVSIVLMGSAFENQQEAGLLAKVIGVILASALLFVLSLAVPVGKGQFLNFEEQATILFSVVDIGQALFEKYFLAFELVGVLLLLVTVGAVMLLQEKKLPLPEGSGLRAKRQEHAKEAK
ncbi:MAG: NADH-quinone oxidoreductase subunit J [Deltaproteobacteria bacterium]|nr:NADH-quinone oxidoreductase subunit J [Deltaproteobacteria bacterium]